MLAAVLALALAAAAPLPARPDLEATSPDGRWRVTLTLGTCSERPRSRAPHDGPHASARLRRPDGREVAFELAAFPTRPAEIRLLDGGDLVAADQEHALGYGTVLARYDAAGREAWARTLEELLSEQHIGRIDVRRASRPWRGERWLRGVRTERDGARTLSIALPWHDRLEIDVATGASRVVVLDDFGDDARAWYDRGRAALRAFVVTQQDQERARPFFARAVEADPSFVPAWIALAASHDGVDALALLERCARANPIRPGEDLSVPPGLPQLDQRLQAEVQRAGLLLRLERAADALALLDRLLAHDPRARYAQEARIETLVALGRTDAALEQAERAHADLLLTLEGAPASDERRVHAARSIGRLLVEHGLHAAALAHYERARGLASYFQSALEEDVARALEALGSIDAARGIVAQLVDAYAAKHERERGGRFGELARTELQRARAWLERLGRE